MQQLEYIANLTDGTATRGVVGQRKHTSVISAPVHTSAAQGDVLQHQGKHHYVLQVNFVSGGIYSTPKYDLDCLPANQSITIRRNGNTIADGLQAHVSTQGDTIDELTQLLMLTTYPDSQIRRQYELRQHLGAAHKLIADTEHELAATLRQRIEQHDTSLRIIVPNGTGASAGDQIDIPEVGTTTVRGLCRKSWTNLTVLLCDPPQSTNTNKRGLFGRSKG